MPRSLDDLNAYEFENLCYDVITSSGFHSVVWRTPGADGGRDLEAYYYSRDASGAEICEKWYIDSKRYSSSVSWPVVFEKVCYAKNNDADFLLICSNSNPSPDCETEIATWNRREKMKVRFWRGYQMSQVLSTKPHVRFKYGLSTDSPFGDIPVHHANMILYKLVTSASGKQSVGSDCSLEITCASSISEMLLRRADSYERYGRFHLELENLESILHGEGLEIDDTVHSSRLDADHTGILSAVHFYIFATQSRTAHIAIYDDQIFVKAVEPRTTLSKSAQEDLRHLSTWAGLELDFKSEIMVMRAQHGE